MRKFYVGAAAIAGAALLSVAAVQAQNGPPPGPPGAHDPARVTAGDYALDATHSYAGWTVSHFGFSDFAGIFPMVAGTMTLDPANVGAAKVDVTIPLASVVSANAGLTGHLLREGRGDAKPDFFGPTPEPAHFVSTSVKKTGDDSATIVGDLTFNGVTKPVTLEAEFTGAGKHPFNGKETVGFTGTGTFKRSDFGLSFLVPMVSDEVRLNVSVAFEK